MLDGVQRIRLAAHALVAERTVIRVYQGRGSPHSRARIARSAVELGLPPPAEPTPSTAAAAEEHAA